MSGIFQDIETPDFGIEVTFEPVFIRNILDVLRHAGHSINPGWRLDFLKKYSTRAFSAQDPGSNSWQ